MAEVVRVRRLGDEEGCKLQRLVRRGEGEGQASVEPMFPRPAIDLIEQQVRTRGSSPTSHRSHFETIAMVAPPDERPPVDLTVASVMIAEGTPRRTVHLRLRCHTVRVWCACRRRCSWRATGIAAHPRPTEDVRSTALLVR